MFIYSLKTIENFILFIFIVIITAGCGGGNSSTSGETTIITKSISGTAIDGYISGATVCLDVNNNDICDNNEPNTTTDSNGSFTLDVNTTVGSKSIIVIGGTDTATGNTFDGILKKAIDIQENTDINSANINPLTTIAAQLFIDEKSNNPSYTLTQAKQRVANNLGITVSDLEDDPMNNNKTFEKSQKIIQSIKLVQADIGNSDSSLYKHIIKEFTKSIQEDNISKDFNISKAVTKLNSSEYNNSNISISSNTVDYMDNNVKYIKKEVENNTGDLSTIQNSLTTNTNDAVSYIHDHNTSGLEQLKLKISNNKPTITSSSTVSVNENQTLAITITATDENTIIYSISGTDASAFDINSTSGVVTFKVAPDYETKQTYSFVAKASDGTNDTTQDVTITILDVNESSSAITYNGITYDIVTSPYTGKIWLDRNLGASEVCTDINDSACFGDYYQWGRYTDGHEKTNSTTSTTKVTNLDNSGSSFITSSSYYDDWVASGVDNDGTLRNSNWSKIDGSSICPIGYRVPTAAEIRAETIDASTAISNLSTAFSNFLKLSASGMRNFTDGSFAGQGTSGHIWSSDTNVSISKSFDYSDSSISISNMYRHIAYPVRCIKD